MTWTHTGVYSNSVPHTGPAAAAAVDLLSSLHLLLIISCSDGNNNYISGTRTSSSEGRWWFVFCSLKSSSYSSLLFVLISLWFVFGLNNNLRDTKPSNLLRISTTCTLSPVWLCQIPAWIIRSPGPVGAADPGGAAVVEGSSCRDTGCVKGYRTTANNVWSLYHNMVEQRLRVTLKKRGWCCLQHADRRPEANQRTGGGRWMYCMCILHVTVTHYYLCR